ncbi:Ig-like domain-containing protein [Spongiactinospora sp. 9N601]|uniref:Ig-like domain-containing protein n=1 Tax=Spongiactinospora sp. 9N601 TaxID=3375149 RepID=UPI0037B6008B
MTAHARRARRVALTLATAVLAVAGTALPALAVTGQSPPPSAVPGETVTIRVEGVKDIQGSKLIYTAPPQTTFVSVSCDWRNTTTGQTGSNQVTYSNGRRSAECPTPLLFQPRVQPTQQIRLRIDPGATSGLKTGQIRMVAAGNSAESRDQGTFQVQVEDPVPPAPVITRPPNGSLRGTQPEIGGTGQDGATVIVRDQNNQPVCVTEVADGQWSCTPTPPFTNGEVTLTATQVDDNGSSEASAPVTFTVNSLIDL